MPEARRISPGGDNPSMALADTQKQRLLELLREAGEEPVAFGELHAGGVSFPAAVVSELGLNGYPIERVMTTGGWSGCACSIQNPWNTRRTPTAPRTVAAPIASPAPGVWLLASAVDRQISGWRAFPWYRSPLALGAGLGPQSAARGRVDALVAIVPADPIARRRIASQHFLNDTRTGSAID